MGLLPKKGELWAQKGHRKKWEFQLQDTFNEEETRFYIAELVEEQKLGVGPETSQHGGFCQRRMATTSWVEA